MPYFSIIIPAYNVQDYIGECLNSILNQTFDDYEIIIIDDSSVDRTYEIALKYSQENACIKLKRIEHVVVGEVRNEAIKCARGKYIVFIDADDYIEKDMLGKIHECLLGKDTEMCFLPNHFVDYVEGKKEHSLIPNLQDENIIFDSRNEFFRYVVEKKGVVPASMWTGVCLKSLIDENNISMDTNYIWSQDSDFMYNVLKCSNKIAICGYRGYVWNRKNTESATRNVSAEKIISRLSVYKKWYEAYDTGNFGDVSNEDKEYLKKTLLKNYCGVLYEFIFMKNGEQRNLVQKKLESDGLWKSEKELVPSELVKYGLSVGRWIFLFKHYSRKVKGLVIPSREYK